jgi:2-amino-4-hydroxy-6-hydroxymethyldihydropteridine diphosphokinase
MADNDKENQLDRLIVVALGSNLAGAHATPAALLEAALERLTEVGLKVRARSSWWRSAAWPDAMDPPFVNAVAIVETDALPREVMDMLTGIEREFGRTRHSANAPRTLDLDLIAYGRVVAADADLILPHPRAHERRFVMGPLAEIAPEWRHPVAAETAAVLAARAAIGADARPIGPPALRKKPRNAI